MSAPIDMTTAHKTPERGASGSSKASGASGVSTGSSTSLAAKHPGHPTLGDLGVKLDEGSARQRVMDEDGELSCFHLLTFISLHSNLHSAHVG